MKNYIGIFDSGIGGFSVLEELKNIYPFGNYIYYKDNKNNPYGEKTEEELLEIGKNIVNFYKEKNTKIIIVACNTMTTRCLDKLKKLYKDIKFIGIEPAIEKVLDKPNKNILVIGTKMTIESNILQNKIKNIKDKNIYLQACIGLANAIENNNIEKIDEILTNLYNLYKDKNIDSIVLGCTHYPLIKDKIKRYFNNVVFYDNSKDVSIEMYKYLKENNLLEESLGSISIYDSKDNTFISLY